MVIIYTRSSNDDSGKFKYSLQNLGAKYEIRVRLKIKWNQNCAVKLSIILFLMPTGAID